MIKKLSTQIIATMVMVAILSLEARGQQDAQYTQFMYNKLPQNAGYTGAREVLSIRALYRDQWSGTKLGGIAGAEDDEFQHPQPTEERAFCAGFLVCERPVGSGAQEPV
ncbi:MAG: type IX secretion system membrane protein PorP/SprF [Sphingobacteriales bacterium]|nr:type IX secretion system membrane protein PorP/SprF [Sphingobacteriales bacterium]